MRGLECARTGEPTAARHFGLSGRAGPMLIREQRASSSPGSTRQSPADARAAPLCPLGRSSRKPSRHHRTAAATGRTPALHLPTARSEGEVEGKKEVEWEVGVQVELKRK